MSYMTIEEMEKRAIEAEDASIKYASMTDDLRNKVEQIELELNSKSVDYFNLEKRHDDLWSKYIDLIEVVPTELLPQNIHKDWAPKQPG